MFEITKFQALMLELIHISKESSTLQMIYKHNIDICNNLEKNGFIKKVDDIYFITQQGEEMLSWFKIVHGDIL